MKRRGSAGAGAPDTFIHDLLSVITGIVFGALVTRTAGSSALFVFAFVCVHLRLVRQILLGGPAFGADGTVALQLRKKDWKSVLFIQRYAIVIQVLFTLLLAAGVYGLIRFVPGILPGMEKAAETLEMLEKAALPCAAAVLAMGIETLYAGMLEGLNRMRTCMIAQLTQVIVRCGGMIAVWHLAAGKPGAVWVSGFLYSVCAGALGASVYMHLALQKAGEALQKNAQNQSRAASPRKKVRSLFYAWFGSSMGIALCIGLMTAVPFWIALYRGFDQAGLAFMQGGAGLLFWLPFLAVYGVGEDGFASAAKASGSRNGDALRASWLLCAGRYLYIAVPIGFSVIVLAPQLMHILFDMKSSAFELIVILQGADGVVQGLIALIAKLMIILQFGGSCVLYLFVGLLIRSGLTWVLVNNMGIWGMYLAGWISALAVLFLCMAKLHNRFEFSGMRTFLHLLKILAACMCMNGLYAAAEMAGFAGLASTAGASLVQFAVILAGGAAVYYLISRIMQVPQALYPSRRRRQS